MVSSLGGREGVIHSVENPSGYNFITINKFSVLP